MFHCLAGQHIKETNFLFNNNEAAALSAQQKCRSGLINGQADLLKFGNDLLLRLPPSAPIAQNRLLCAMLRDFN
jgi:hypothetical protein